MKELSLIEETRYEGHDGLDRCVTRCISAPLLRVLVQNGEKMLAMRGWRRLKGVKRENLERAVGAAKHALARPLTKNAGAW